MWKSWWQCHQRWQELRVQIERAGIQRQDPLYPLIIEMGLLPSRLARLAAACFGALMLLILLAAALAVIVQHTGSGIRIDRQSDGTRVVSLEIPPETRRIPCAPWTHYQLCLKFPSPDKRRK